MTDSAEINKTGDLTLQKAVKIFIGSFKYSRGSSSLQKRLFSYLKIQNPNWSISNDLLQRLKTEVRAPIENIVNPRKLQVSDVHFSVQEHEIEKTIEQELQSMVRKFDFKQTDYDYRSKEEYLQGMVISMVDRDRHFLDSEKPQFTRDPNLSYVCFYAIEGNKTGIEEFDEVYKDVANFIKTGCKFNKDTISELQIKIFKDNLKYIMDNYKLTHPDSNI
jgi:hypothetical protein